MRQTIISTLKEFKGTILFIVLMLVFRSSLADWNHVPTGSMKPTILEGDRVLINKIAYDLNLPFSSITVARLAEPKRGDIVVFNSKVSEIRLIKRVVGVPGDTVAMTDNQITINGESLRYKLNENSSLQGSNSLQADLIENLMGVSHQIRVHKRASRASTFNAVRVPKDMYLVLGDNRDNSVDSRYIGLVPRKEIIGRSSSVAFSLDYENYYIPRKDRVFKTL
jgi:signal peptidase I